MVIAVCYFTTNNSPLDIANRPIRVHIQGIELDWAARYRPREARIITRKAKV